MEIEIQPITFFRDTATKLVVEGVQVRSLGEGGTAIILYALNAADGKRISNGIVELNGEKYSLWGSDDSYVMNQVVESLGVVRVEPVAPTPVNIPETGDSVES